MRWANILTILCAFAVRVPAQIPAGACPDTDKGYRTVFDGSVAKIRWSLLAVSEAKEEVDSKLQLALTDASVISVANTLSIWGRYAQTCKINDAEQIAQLQAQEKFAEAFFDITSGGQFPTKLIVSGDPAAMLAKKGPVTFSHIISNRLELWKKMGSALPKNPYVIAAIQLSVGHAVFDETKIQWTAPVPIQAESVLSRTDVDDVPTLSEKNKFTTLLWDLTYYYKFSDGPPDMLPAGTIPK
jgi:hypothetical protein